MIKQKQKLAQFKKETQDQKVFNEIDNPSFDCEQVLKKHEQLKGQIDPDGFKVIECRRQKKWDDLNEKPAFDGNSGVVKKQSNEDFEKEMNEIGSTDIGKG